MVVLDTSALMAVLLDELGAENVVPHLHGSSLSIVNLCEVLTKSVDRGADLSDAECLIATYGVRIQPFERDHAAEAARLRPLTKHLGLGLGDRACLAQAKLSEMPVLTADRAWGALHLGIDIRLIR